MAIECSNPAATKAAMGGTMTMILSVVLRAPNDIHTARQTSTLQSTARKNSWTVGKRRFGRSDGERRLADSAAAKSVLPGKEHQCGGADRAGDIADIDQ